jgi:hypothetical protein
LTVNDVFTQFLACFGDKHNNGMITLAEWRDYYSAVSAQIENDSHFFDLMTTTWRL